MKKLTLLLLITIPLTGCTLGQKVIEKGIEKSIEKNTGAQDVDISEGGVSYKTDEGEASFGQNANLTSDFPEIVPIYQDSELNYSASQEQDGSQAWTAIWIVEKPAEQIYDDYISQYESEDWNVTNQSSFRNDDKNYFAFNAEKDGYAVTVTVLDSEDSKASLTVAVQKS